MALTPPTAPLPAFVSRQVSEARRFFLNLTPNRRSSLEIVCGGVERMRPDYVVQRSDFPYFALELVAEGTGSLQIHEQQYRLSAGSVFAYGPGAAHTIRNTGRAGMRKFYLDFVGTEGAQLLQSAGLLTSNQQYTSRQVGRLHELTEVFELMFREAEGGGPMAESLCVALTQLLFLKLRQLRLPADVRLPRAFATYERVRSRIDRDFLELQSAQDVADACQMTAVHLSRLFRRFGDCGAYQYLMRRKMNFAAGLLMNEGLMVKEVAARLNFADPFQFSRSFKRIYGVSPRELLLLSNVRAPDPHDLPE